MIRYQRSAQARCGQLLETIQSAKQIAAYLNAKHPAVSFQVFTERFGNFGTVCLHADYKDLPSLESISAQILADQECWAHLNKAAAHVIDGSVRETLLSSVKVLGSGNPGLANV